MKRTSAPTIINTRSRFLSVFFGVLFASTIPGTLAWTMSSRLMTGMAAHPGGGINKPADTSTRNTASTTTSSAAAAAAAADFQEIARELQTLADMHGMEERQFLRRSRNKLQPRHIAEFSSNTLFDRFARVVCQVLVIPRKEIFETWAMALYVHHQFPNATRIADLACSHGLLSWALLLLAQEEHLSSPTTATASTDKPTNVKRSVVCIDLKMPKSAEKIATAMLHEWPALQNDWDYVEGPLEALQPDASTLLVGIHACGVLSDKVVRLAIQGNAAVALVPCCHSKKCLTPDQKEEMRKTESASSNTSRPGVTKDNMVVTLADFIDRYRIKRLQSAGFIVQEAHIPDVFTPKNRIIMGTPPSTTNSINTPPRDPSILPEEPAVMSLTTKGNPQWGLPKFCIPVADTPIDRATVRDMAGRDASTQRQQKPPVSLCVSLLLPRDNIQLSAQELTVALPLPETKVEVVCDEPFWHDKSQRHARTFKVIYPQGEPKKRCKEYHQIFREAIPKAIPGAQVRY
jgi:hypothetical protein